MLEVDLAAARLQLLHNGQGLLRQLGQRGVAAVGSAAHHVDGDRRVPVHGHQQARHRARRVLREEVPGQRQPVR